MKFTLPSDTYNFSQLTTRNILKHPKNPEIRDLQEATAPKNIEADHFFIKANRRIQRRIGQQNSK